MAVEETLSNVDSATRSSTASPVTKLYSPGIIATYSAIGGLPLGCILYGINASRRGSQRMGDVLFGVGTVTYAFMLAVAALGIDVRVFGLLGVLGGIGFYQMESAPCERAIRHGATLARRWPPAIAAVGAAIVLVAVRRVVSR
jgi:hypothetical protein